jgi:amidohydrolase
MAAQAVIQLQLMTGREFPPKAGILSVTRVAGGSTHNVIPETSLIQGTIRTQTPESYRLYQKRLEEICGHIAEGHKGKVEMKYTNRNSVIYNDPALTERLRLTLIELFGEEAPVLIEDTAMFGEDMSEYMKQVPGVYFAHSSIFGDERDYPHHHSRFTVNESVLWRGTAAMAAFALHWQDGYDGCDSPDALPDEKNPR